MNKLNIINDLAKEKNLTINDAEKIVSTIVEEISKSLIQKSGIIQRQLKTNRVTQ